jgi:hypothetical protein
MEIHEIGAVAMVGSSSNRDVPGYTRQVLAATPGRREAPQRELAPRRHLRQAAMTATIQRADAEQIPNERA